MIALTAMTIQIIDNNPDGIRICRVDGGVACHGCGAPGYVE